MCVTGRKSTGVPRAPVHATATEARLSVLNELVAGYKFHRVRAIGLIHRLDSMTGRIGPADHQIRRVCRSLLRPAPYRVTCEDRCHWLASSPAVARCCPTRIRPALTLLAKVVGGWPSRVRPQATGRTRLTVRDRDTPGCSVPSGTQWARAC